MNAAPSRQSPLIDTDWWSVMTVTVGITVFAIAQGLTYPLISLLLAERGASETIVGLNAAAFMAGIATSVLVIPSLTQHLRAGQVIVAGLAGAAIILIGFAVSESLAAWFLLRFALGFCVNAIYVFGEAWLNAASADRVRGRVAGIYSAGMTLGFVIGPLAIPLFGTDDGLAFAACAVLISLAAFGLAVMSRRARIEPDKLALSDLPRFLRAGPLLVLLVIVFGFVDATVLSLAPLHMTSGGASAAAAATFIAVMHIGMIVTQPLLGVMLDRMDRWRVASACLAATGCIFGALIFLPVTGMLIWPLGALGGAAFIGIYTSALAILGQEYRGAMLVAGASAFSMAYGAGGMFGPALTGLLVDSFPGSTFALIASLSAGSALLLVWRR
ncbi:MFS transporter [Thalassococcus sp. S3]|uniref:MFS transporter n=1 Tax=Thalassococcus sp. S3 TaxID=2017482 RepID=UPI00102489E6|nr:MFS transporter [Thalassococcus sp. S3]QBF31409.1 MFS transporter [Thalassococcus sp. S3]